MGLHSVLWSTAKDSVVQLSQLCFDCHFPVWHVCTCVDPFFEKRSGQIQPAGLQCKCVCRVNKCQLMSVEELSFSHSRKTYKRNLGGNWFMEMCLDLPEV